MIEAIVAVYSDWGIGCGGTQPVVVHADRRRFREVTDGAAVIVGRKTLADFPGGRPLKGRENIVLSRTARAIPGAVVMPDEESALREAKKYPRAIVIGGASVYEQLLPETERVYVTKIDARPASDAFFPDLDADPAWRCTDPGKEQAEEGVSFRFAVYERVR